MQLMLNYGEQLKIIKFPLLTAPLLNWTISTTGYCILFLLALIEPKCTTTHITTMSLQNTLMSFLILKNFKKYKPRAQMFPLTRQLLLSHRFPSTHNSIIINPFYENPKEPIPITPSLKFIIWRVLSTLEYTVDTDLRVAFWEYVNYILLAFSASGMLFVLVFYFFGYYTAMWNILH